MNYDELQPGRELDALVAEKVMGWSFVEPRHGTCCTCQNCGRPCDECGDGCQYSTDIGAAWEVVEKLRHDDFWWSASYKTGIGPDAKHFVTFRCVRAGIRGDHHAYKKSLPHAICIAALKAVTA